MPTAEIKEKRKRVAKVKIYRVEMNGEVRLVKATAKPQVLKYIRKGLQVDIITQEDLIDCVRNGMNIEEANGKDE